ncbi:MAG TPA: hypothetical protein VN944_01150 [Nitrospiria bacterium]|nr:hypothetical protein [Nitrospiria bacterium]
MFYEDIFKAFHDKGIRYVVIGGVAINLHGAPRMTADLDILADLEGDNLALFIKTMKELGYRTRLPVPAEGLLDPQKRQEWIREKGLKAFTFYHPIVAYQEVDLLIDSPISFSEINQQKIVIKMGLTEIPVISIDHLIEMKKGIGRQQDAADIQTLEKIKNFKGHNNV